MDTPRKIHMEPEKDDLEDNIPFQVGDFLGSMLSFRGVQKRYSNKVSCCCETIGSHMGMRSSCALGE